LATRFDPTGSLSGLHYEPINVKILGTSLGSQKCLQKVNVKGLCPIGIPKMYAVFLTLIGS
jgi:hypothetical protein